MKLAIDRLALGKGSRLFFPRFEHVGGVKSVSLVLICERAQDAVFARARSWWRDKQARSQNTIVTERCLEEVEQCLLKLGFATGPHAARDGDVNRHVFNGLGYSAAERHSGEPQSEITWIDQ